MRFFILGATETILKHFGVLPYNYLNNEAEAHHLPMHHLCLMVDTLICYPRIYFILITTRLKHNSIAIFYFVINFCISDNINYFVSKCFG